MTTGGVRYWKLFDEATELTKKKTIIQYDRGDAVIYEQVSKCETCFYGDFSSLFWN